MYYLYFLKEPSQKFFLVSVDYNAGILKFSKDLSSLNLFFKDRCSALDCSIKIQKDFGLVLSIYYSEV